MLKREKIRCCCFPPPPHFVYLCSESRNTHLFTKSFVMRYFQLLAFSSLCLLGLFGVVSCDNMSAEPEAVPRSVTIAAEGGVATTKLKRIDGGKLKSKWAFKYVHLDLYGDVRDSTVQVDTLTDGRVKYSGAWYAFYVSKGRDEIQVELQPNHTNSRRSVTFVGQHQDGFATSFDFSAYQDATRQWLN